MYRKLEGLPPLSGGNVADPEGILNADSDYSKYIAPLDDAILGIVKNLRTESGDKISRVTVTFEGKYA